ATQPNAGTPLECGDGRWAVAGQELLLLTQAAVQVQDLYAHDNHSFTLTWLIALRTRWWTGKNGNMAAHWSKGKSPPWPPILLSPRCAGSKGAADRLAGYPSEFYHC